MAAIAAGLAPSLAVRARARDTVVGAVLPLTGPAAPWGVGAWNGLRLACALADHAGPGGARLEPRVLDTEGRAELAARHAERLVRGGAVVLVGAAQSVSALVVGDVAERSGVPLLTTTDLEPTLTSRGYRFTFRAIPAFPALALGLLAAARTEAGRPGRPARRLALLSERSVIGEAALEAARMAAPERGFEVVDASLYDPAAPDPAATLARYRATGVDVVAGYHPAPALGLLAGHFEQEPANPRVLAWLGPEPPTLAGSGLAGPRLLASALWSPAVPVPALGELAARYRDRAGETLGVAGAVGLSVGALVMDAWRRAGSADGSALREALAGTELRAGQGTYVLMRGVRFLPGGENAWAEGVVLTAGAQGWRVRTG